MIGIYSYIDVKTMEVLYVGQSRNIYQRHRGHFSGSQPIDKVLAKDPIRYQLRIECECSIDELNDKEKYYIAKYNPLYNCTKGGDYRHSEMSVNNKYTLWDTKKLHYVSHINQNRNRPFRLWYNSQYVPIGYFEEWFTGEMLWNMINDEVGDNDET